MLFTVAADSEAVTMASHSTRIERFEGTAMPVNSYVVEGPEGLVIVDGQLTVSDARALRALIDQFNRPVAAMVLTHGHPDHYAGAATALDGLSAPIVATTAVADVIRRDDQEKDGIVGPMMGNEWPTVRRFPDKVADAGAVIMLGGLAWSLRELGPAESQADTLWSLDHEAVTFAGDVAYNDMHAYLADGRFREWLDVLDQLDKELDDDITLLVGHGNPTDKSVLGRQRDYVSAFVESVRADLDAAPDRRREAVAARMKQVVANDDLLFLMELSIEPVVAVLASVEHP